MYNEYRIVIGNYNIIDLLYLLLHITYYVITDYVEYYFNFIVNMYHYLFLINVRIHELKRNNVRIIKVTYNGGTDNRGFIVYNKNTIYTIM